MTPQEIITLIEQSPELQRTLRSYALTGDLLELPARFDKLESEFDKFQSVFDKFQSETREEFRKIHQRLDALEQVQQEIRQDIKDLQQGQREMSQNIQELQR